MTTIAQEKTALTKRFIGGIITMAFALPIMVIAAKTQYFLTFIPGTLQVGAVGFLVSTFAVARNKFTWLDERAASENILFYVFMGLVGFPVFATGGGLGYLFSPTFGFIAGFVIAAMLAETPYILKTLKEYSTRGLAFMVMGQTAVILVTIYGCGILYPVIFLPEPGIVAMAKSVTPYILTDVVELFCGLAIPLALYSLFSRK